VICENPQQVYKALGKLESQFKVVRVKDRFEKPVNGYRDMLVNLEMSNGHIVEVQLHVRSVMEVKNGAGHKLYEESRSIYAKAKTENRPLTAQEAETVGRLEQQQKQLYDDAYQTAMEGVLPAEVVRDPSQKGGATVHYDEFNWLSALEHNTESFPELRPIKENVNRNPSQQKQLLIEGVENVRRQLLQQEDINAVYQSARKLGVRVDRSTLEAIKQYNFNSVGINFNFKNYSKWKRLARGEASVNDAAYLLHEATEVKELQKIQKSEGFDFMGKDFGKMNRTEKALWEDKFEQYYLKAHDNSLKKEYRFISKQIEEVTRGEISLSNDENGYLLSAIAEPDKSVRSENLRYLSIKGEELGNLSNFSELKARAESPLDLSGDIKQKLGIYSKTVTLEDIVRRVKSMKISRMQNQNRRENVLKEDSDKRPEFPRSQPRSEFNNIFEDEIIQARLASKLSEYDTPKLFAESLASEAAKASKIDLSKYVDEVNFGQGYSSFSVDNQGKRKIFIGTSMFKHRSGDAGYLMEAIHEIVHAQQFDRVLRRNNENISLARDEHFDRYNFTQYDKNEIMAEGMALRRAEKYLGNVPAAEKDAALKYVNEYRKSLDEIK
jgi:hypothetical protein